MKEIKNCIPSTRLFLWENGGRGAIIGFHPTVFIEVTKEDVSIQDAAIKSHASQCERHSYFETHALTNAERWGAIYGCEYAEAFIEVMF